MAIDMEGVRYRVVRGDSLTSSDIYMAQQILESSVMMEYPLVDCSSEYYRIKRANYTGQVIRTYADPNKSVKRLGHPDAPLRPRQAFTDPVVVFAESGDDGSGLFCLDIANNASSHRFMGPLGPIERYAKLNIPRFIPNRYARLGQSGMSPELQEEAMANRGVNIAHIAIAVGLHGRDPQQRVRTWARLSEQAYLTVVGGTPLHRLDDPEDPDRRDTEPLGPGGPITDVGRWGGATVDAVVGAILEKDGARDLVATALAQVGF